MYIFRMQIHSAGDIMTRNFKLGSNLRIFRMFGNATDNFL